MKRDQAGPILDKRTKAQPWQLYLTPDAPKVRIAELLLKKFPDAEKTDAIQDLGTGVIRHWRDFDESFSDESPEADVHQEAVTLHGSKTGTTASGFVVFHKGELWLASERII